MTVRAPLDFQSVRSKVSALIAAENLPPHFVSIVERWYVPIAARVADTHAQQDRPILVSVSGAQGSGKSTLTTLVRLLLKEIWQLKAVDVSLDDFYPTHAERQQLAQDVHPLLATRGVPSHHYPGLNDSKECLVSTLLYALFVAGLCVLFPTLLTQT